MKLQEVLDRIELMMKKPNPFPETSEQMRVRADRMQQTRTAILLTGGKVKKEYE